MLQIRHVDAGPECVLPPRAQSLQRRFEVAAGVRSM
jgi:hypothetical protein